VLKDILLSTHRALPGAVKAPEAEKGKSVCVRAALTVAISDRERPGDTILIPTEWSFGIPQTATGTRSAGSSA
jgi:hypothetical protein